MVSPQLGHSGLEQFGEQWNSVNHKPKLSHEAYPTPLWDSGVIEQLCCNVFEYLLGE